LNESIISSINVICSAHLSLLALISPNLHKWSVQIKQLLIINLLHPPATFSILGPNIIFRTLFSDTLNMCFSLNVRDQFSQSYKTTGKIIILRICSG
jgi:hypothetical protein